VTLGIDFGSQAEGFLRFSYTNSLEKIEEGLVRLQQYLGSR
jgi:aspartate/methionine/tyrosine aminotransferase